MSEKDDGYFCDHCNVKIPSNPEPDLWCWSMARRFMHICEKCKDEIIAEGRADEYRRVPLEEIKKWKAMK